MGWLSSTALPPILLMNSSKPLILFWLLAARFALGWAYSVSVPIWEADNEDGHFAYARYIAVKGRLLQAGDPEAESIFQKFQPPLYYILAALYLRALNVNLGERFEPPEKNPYIHFGAPSGVNYALHPPADQLTPTHIATTQAVLATRLLSVLISTLSLIPLYWVLGRIWPHKIFRQVGIVCLYAFWPQFLFTGSMVTNDVLVAALGTATFAGCIYLIHFGFSFKRFLMVSFIAGLACLTKINGLGLIPMLLAALAYSLRNQASSRFSLRQFAFAVLGMIALFAVGITLLSSLKFVTEQVLQLSTLQAFVRRFTEQHSLSDAVKIAEVIFRTVIASYGWGNLETHPWVYTVWEIAALMAVLGLIVLFRRQVDTAPIKPIVLTACVATVTMAGLMIALGLSQNNVFVPGRYLLPGLGPLSICLFWGWGTFLNMLKAGSAKQALVVGLVILGWWLPGYTLIPEYAHPQPLTAAQKAVLVSREVYFDETIKLLGYLPSNTSLQTDEVRLRLCWQATAPITKNYIAQLELLGPDQNKYGSLTTYPGRGQYPTSFWSLNQQFCDEYLIPFAKNFPAPALGQIYINLLDPSDFQPLPITGLQGESLKSVTVPVRIYDSRTLPSPTNPLKLRLGESLQLNGYDVWPLTDQSGWRITLHWEALAPIQEQAVIFVHLRTAPDQIYIQDDSQPRQNSYPTYVWAAGEKVLDEHILLLPEGPVPQNLLLFIGAYHSPDGQLTRLPITDGAGQSVPNNEIQLPFP